MGKPKPVGMFRRLFNAARYSVKGYVAAWKNERAFREETVALIVIIPLALWLGNGALQKALLIASWLLVMTAELLNSAVEAVVDRIGSEYHELSGRAKDLGSAAVLTALFIAALIWGAVIVLRCID